MVPLLAAATAVLLAGQLPQASVAGVVRDGETGSPLPGAAVTMPDLARTTVTSTDGRYLFADVPAGPHHLSIRLIGYTPRSLHAIVPRDGRLQIDVGLRSLPIQLAERVIRAAPVLGGHDTTGAPPFPARQASQIELRHHPLLAEPDFLQALGGGEVAIRPEAPAGVHVRGGSQDQTAFILDGIPIISPYHAGGVFSAVNPDAIGRAQIAPVPPAAATHALAGVVELSTRESTPRLQLLGAMSTTQARMTAAGPLGVAGITILASLRTGFPGIFAPKREASYLRGATDDRLARIEIPLLGGTLRLLGYDSENEISTAAAAPPVEGDTVSTGGRHVFEWHSSSLGAEWRRALPRFTVALRGWSAVGDANVHWADSTAPMDLASRRRDAGLHASVETGSARARTALGLRLERIRTSYHVAPLNGSAWSLNGPATVSTALAHHARMIGRTVELSLGAALALHRTTWYPGPSAQLRWQASDRLAVVGSYARTYQFAQSLRNSESLAGTVLPADLYAAAGGPVPVARADQGMLAAELQPASGVHLGVQAYQRRSHGLMLVAPVGSDPFSTGQFVSGEGVARGVSASATAGTARVTVLARYGLQQVQLRHGGSSYTPEHAATHLFEGGVTVFPGATTSIRVGVTGALGRRGTASAGTVEWESCNLRDKGCEFAGSPRTTGAPGAERLPGYLRVDLGARQHWHLRLGGREATLALFATFTNVLGRNNVLAWLDDPAGSRLPLEMRPRGPLVAGLDWQF